MIVLYSDRWLVITVPLDDKHKSLILFPSFPVKRFNVRFKLQAPLNT